MKKRLVSKWACLLLLGFAIAPLSGQEYRARVQGAVTDPSQAAVANAKITLKNTNTGISSVKETDTAGNYRFDYVQPGTYSVAVEATGFSKFVKEEIAVLTAGDVTVNAQLSVGAVTESVTVEAEAATVQFNTSSMSQTVVGKMLDQLPVLARN